MASNGACINPELIKLISCSVFMLIFLDALKYSFLTDLTKL